MLGLVFAAQLGLIFWLSDRAPLGVRAPAVTPTLHLAGPASGPWLALHDPTLFALPHQQGFSGPAWLQVPRQESPPFVWAEPAHWLELPVEQLGVTFNRFIETNPFSVAEGLPRAEPELTQCELGASAAFPQKSRLRQAGGLAGRRLLTPIQLTNWTCVEMLTNTVVQMLLDVQGRPVSLRLDSFSGLKSADQYALDQARVARFEPLSGPGPQTTMDPLAGLQWGQLIFEWQTVPLLQTNAAAGN
jgi:hypothetical protein